jgi:hypothetical protein
MRANQCNPRVHTSVENCAPYILVLSVEAPFVFIITPLHPRVRVRVRIRIRVRVKVGVRVRVIVTPLHTACRYTKKKRLWKESRAVTSYDDFSVFHQAMLHTEQTFSVFHQSWLHTEQTFSVFHQAWLHTKVGLVIQSRSISGGGTGKRNKRHL